MCEHINIMTLDTLREGEEAVLSFMDEAHTLRDRLTDLGWTPGTPIRCVRVSPLGDPIAYGVRGAVIALRRADSHGIHVCREEGTR